MLSIFHPQFIPELLIQFIVNSLTRTLMECEAWYNTLPQCFGKYAGILNYLNECLSTREIILLHLICKVLLEESIENTALKIPIEGEHIYVAYKRFHRHCATLCELPSCLHLCLWTHAVPNSKVSPAHSS